MGQTNTGVLTPVTLKVHIDNNLHPKISRLRILKDDEVHLTMDLLSTEDNKKDWCTTLHAKLHYGIRSACKLK